MEYRGLGRTGLQVGVIGLGTEHLDRSAEVRDGVLRTAVEAGVNFVDLLYVDADYWDSFGAVFRPYREQFVVAAHWGDGANVGVEASQRCFDNVLAQLGNGYAELAMMTMVDTMEGWADWGQESLARLQRYQEQGRIGHIALSGHVEAVALEAVRSGLIDVLMFPVNLVGHDSEDNRAVRRACAEENVGLVAMKPYHGGTLLFAAGRPSGITPTQCLAYVLDQEVATTVPGARTVVEMQATLHYLEATDEEKDYGTVAQGLYDILAGQCVYCHHCLPCPVDIPVGWIMWQVDYARNGLSDDLKGWYASHPAKASDCIECGDCLARCAFDVDIMAQLQKAVEIFEAA
jgi:predicted aldo/keto reductase-like oxidoreductase